MEEFKHVEVSFCTINHGIIKVPANLTKEQEISDFIEDKITLGELENWIDGEFDFDLEDLEIENLNVDKESQGYSLVSPG